jgi:four helix bundle protein
MVFYDKDFPNKSFQDQIMRAVLSIWNNIAKWHDRGSNNDFDNFLYMAHGSAAEFKNMLYIAYELWYIPEDQKVGFAEQTSTIMVSLSRLAQK